MPVKGMATASSNLNILNLLNSSTDYLEKYGIENSRLNAERILCSAINLNRVQLYLNYDRPLTDLELLDFKKRLKRRATSEPLQYILGETEFFSLPFKINSDVLIPRPETELLVESVLTWAKATKKLNSKLSVLDVGTGSGCIAISLAKHIENCIVTAVDISAEAIEVAQDNARLNEVHEKINFSQLNFLNSNDLDVLNENYDIVVSNPPYIAKDEFENLPLEVKGFEPPVALHDKADGYLFYRALADFSPSRLKKDGLLTMEIGLGQAEIVKQLMQKHFTEIKIDADFNGIDRIVSCQFLHLS